jgi:hypothetical protein
MLKKGLFISLASAILVMAGIVVFCRYSTVPVTVNVQPPDLLRPQDVSLIKQSVERARWNIAQAAGSDHEFKILFINCIPDLTIGHVCEIGSLPDGPGSTGRRPNYFSSCAYAVSRNRFGKKGIRYELQLTNNNWEIRVVSPER